MRGPPESQKPHVSAPLQRQSSPYPLGIVHFPNFPNKHFLALPCSLPPMKEYITIIF